MFDKNISLIEIIYVGELFTIHSFEYISEGSREIRRKISSTKYLHPTSPNWAAIECYFEDWIDFDLVDFVKIKWKTLLYAMSNIQ